MSGALIWLDVLKTDLIILLEGGFIGAFSLFSLFTYYYHSSTSHEAKRKTFFDGIKVFFLTFISVQFVLLVTQRDLTIATVTSVVVALANSFLGLSIRVYWRHVAIQPRLCLDCRRDLSGFKQDISNCPYCGKDIDNH